MWNWPLGRVLLPIFWCWTVEHSCKLMERKTGVSVWATESQTQEKNGPQLHSAQKCLLPLTASHKSHTAPPASKEVWERRLLFARKDKVFPGQGKATRKIWRENCYSLKIAVWDSNDSHLRPMTSASELGTQRRGKKFYKEGWEQGIRQVSEEHISSALKWLNAHSIPSRQPWYWALRAGCEAQYSWGR